MTVDVKLALDEFANSTAIFPGNRVFIGGKNGCCYVYRHDLMRGWLTPLVILPPRYVSPASIEHGKLDADGVRIMLSEAGFIP